MLIIFNIFLFFPFFLSFDTEIQVGELKLKQILNPESHKTGDIKQSLQCDEFGYGSYKK